MSATLDYEIKKALPFLTKDNRWNVLTVLILHANIRNRCWPSMDTITEMATNGNRTKATRAKQWLERHGAFENVAYKKRVAEELKLSPRQTIYQLLGSIHACTDINCDCGHDGQTYHYLYVGKQNLNVQTNDNLNGQTINNLNGETNNSLNGDTLSITNEVLPKEVLDAPKSRRKSDPEFDVIALVWHTDAGGYISNIQGMLFGSKKVKGLWDKSKVIPPATVEEIKAFGTYATNRAQDGKIPTQPDTIQRWFGDFRKETAKRENVASKIISFDLSEWEIPETESA